ncbi:MAG: hypothetical protein R3C49_12345 [Planctomycetaceae bacterium]
MTSVRLVSGDDLKVGSHVTISRSVAELPSFFWGCDSSREPETPVRFRYVPSNSGSPLRVKAICLPYLFVEDLSETNHILDLRRCQLVLLDESFASTIRGARKKDFRKQKKRLKAARKMARRRK